MTMWLAASGHPEEQGTPGRGSSPEGEANKLILFTPTPNILSTPGVFTHPGGQAAD